MINKRRNYTQSISKPILKNSTPTTTHPSSSIFSNIKDTIVAGFGLGIGNEIAHRAVSSIMGPRTVEIQRSQTISCEEELAKYEKCLKQNNCMDEQEFYQQCVKIHI